MDIKLNLQDFDNVMIYTFGKVASKSLLETFKQYIKTNDTHYFKKGWLKKKTLVINVTRNLFDRNISALFQCITAKKPPKKEDYIIPPNGKHIREGCFLYTKQRNINELTTFFRNININKLLKIRAKNWYSYFNEELNINIFSDDFDFKKKYAIYETPNITTIILRFEDITEWDNIFGNIFTHNIKIKKHNLTKRKPIYNLYNDFKKKYKYSDEEINIIKSIDFMKKFYTQTEIDTFIQKYNAKEELTSDSTVDQINKQPSSESLQLHQESLQLHQRKRANAAHRRKLKRLREAERAKAERAKEEGAKA